MEWVRLYTALLTHPKQEQTPAKAWKVLTLAWLYAGAHETDGHVPSAARRVIGMTPAIEGQLVALGWLHRNGSGWVLHDWDEHQEPAAAIKRRRDLARKRQADKRRRDRGEGDA